MSKNKIQSENNITACKLTNLLKQNSSISSYRKNYLVFDGLECANKPKSYTEKTKRLGKASRALLAVVPQKIKKKDKIFLNHKYISTITECGRRQNQNIIKELSDVLEIKYHNLIFDDGKKNT